MTIRKRTTAVLLLICLFIGFAVPAFAEERSTSAEAAGFRYGSQLSGAAREIYNALDAKAGTAGSDVTVAFETGVSGSEELGSAIAAARTAYVYDHPGNFWMNGALGCSFAGKDGVITKATLKTAELYRSDYSSVENVQKDAEKLADAAASFPVSGTTRYEKVTSLHDGLISKVSYDKAAQKAIVQNGGYAVVFRASEATGALLDGKAVCEGYAKAFKLLCDQYGIPCVVVYGNYKGVYHAWNYVQMEDGCWYGVDTTSDDAVKDTRTFFLMGADGMKNYSPATSTVSVASTGYAG